MAKLHEVPVIIKDLNDQEALEVALVENLQRQDLSSLEEAEGYQRLMDEFSHTQEGLAKTVGKSRSHVANTLRLLGLPGPVKKMLGNGELSAGHARAVLNTPDPVSVARQVVKKELNVRQTERLVRKKQRQKEKPKTPEKKDVDTAALERDLANLLGWLRDAERERFLEWVVTAREGLPIDDPAVRVFMRSFPPPAGTAEETLTHVTKFRLGHALGGTQDASVSLGGLPYDKALRIRDYLVEGDKRDGV